MPGLLNVGSLICGLIAWIAPLFTLKKGMRKAILATLISVSTCMAAICMQMFYQNHLVKIEDWSALMDTNGFMTILSTILAVITMIINVFNLNSTRNKEKE